MADHDRYAIDGLRPTAVERPTSVHAVAELLASARADGLAVAPVGGGGALHLGNPIERYDLALDLTGLDRILEHHPTDLVLSVEAGVRLGELRDVLARHGQWLPIEAPDPDRATVGGLIATALSGPGRAAHGSLRDALIGIAVASPAGGVAKAGGMVVKNVSGFDLMRLHHGALGTLGVIVSANFKVLPRPPSQTTVLVDAESPTAALAAVERVRGLEATPAAVVVEREPGSEARVAVRYDGRTTAVTTAGRLAAEALGGGARTVSEHESRGWWQGTMDRLGRAGSDRIEMRFGCRPDRSGELTDALLTSVAEHDISGEWQQVWPDLGTLILRWPARHGSVPVDALAGAAEGIDATWRVMDAPVDVKRGRDVWGRPPAALDTLRRLKREFDPDRTLNPGRFCGHL